MTYLAEYLSSLIAYSQCTAALTLCTSKKSACKWVFRAVSALLHVPVDVAVVPPYCRVLCWFVESGKGIRSTEYTYFAQQLRNTYISVPHLQIFLFGTSKPPFYVRVTFLFACARTLVPLLSAVRQSTNGCYTSTPSLVTYSSPCLCHYSFSTVFTTAGGVKFIVLKEGSGPVARDGDFCVVDFTG